MTTATTTNTETVAAIYAAFGAGDVVTILSHLTDDISWDEGVRETGLAWVQAGRGKDHVLGFFGALSTGMSFTMFDVVAITSNADYVVGVVREAGTILATGKPVEEDLFVHVWQFDASGKVASFRHVGDWARQEIPSR